MLEDVHAVIQSAKARDRGRLAEAVQARVPGADDETVRQMSASALATIESIPALLILADDEAQRLGITRVVRPLLRYAVRYFVEPMDVVPEMTKGVAGLLDDAYLSLKILEHINSGPTPLFTWEFESPLRFLGELLGPDVSRKLDRRSIAALNEVSEQVNEVWSALARPA